jgi:hypothetical protein
VLLSLDEVKVQRPKYTADPNAPGEKQAQFVLVGHVP